jgi:aminodeoxyfutalosine deaminase
MHKFTADHIFCINRPVITDQVVITDDFGEILAIEPEAHHDPITVRKFKGAIIPGMINTHCHLELSHMYGKVGTGTGLIPFITSVVTQRNVDPEIISDCIAKADNDMYQAGIVAVGDISNTLDTIITKSISSLKYHSFIEMFDFLQEENANSEFEKYESVFSKFSENLKPSDKVSRVPHAPYSVSKNLFSKINKKNSGLNNITISIHNQETPPEMELFEKGSGSFYAFYEKFGIDLSRFIHDGKSSIHYALENLDKELRTLFVHNTLTTKEDIQAAKEKIKNAFWCSCPNANLYIENRLPNYKNFLESDAKVTLGTDSLTSNWQLSIWEEMKTISKYQSYVPFETLLTWATLNGAEALGFEGDLGSIEVGKKPGLVLIDFQNGQVNWNSSIHRII